MIYGVLLYTFYVWNNFKLVMRQGNGYFYAIFVYMLWGKSNSLSLVSPTITNIDKELVFYLEQV